MSEKISFQEKLKSIIDGMNQGFVNNQFLNISAGSYGYNMTNGGTLFKAANHDVKDQFRIDMKRAWNSLSVKTGFDPSAQLIRPLDETFMQRSSMDFEIEENNDKDLAGPGTSTAKIKLQFAVDPDANLRILGLHPFEEEVYGERKHKPPIIQKQINFRRFVIDAEHLELILYGKESQQYESIWNGLPADHKISDYPSIVVGKGFFDHTFALPKPLTKNQINKFYPEGKAMFVDKKPVYNYTIPDYQSWSQSPDVSATSLPNFYNVISANYADNPSTDVIESQLPIWDQFPKKGIMKSGEAQANNFLFANTYFKNYANTWDSLDNAAPLEGGQTITDKIRKKNQNICVTEKNYKFLTDYTSRAADFPFYSYFEFRTTNTNELADVASQTQIGKPLMQWIAASKTNQAVGEPHFSWWPIIKGSAPFKTFQKAYVQEADQPSLSVEVSNAAAPQNYDYFDLSDWVSNYKWLMEGKFEGQDPLSLITQDFIGEEEGKFLSDADPQYNFYKTMLAFVFSKKYDEMVKKYTRTYKEVIDGKLAHSEILLYRIDKYQYNADGQPQGPIQVYWVQNTNSLDVLSLIDTQVKFGKRFNYKISAYTAVFGTRYEYVGTPSFQDGIHGADKDAAVVTSIEGNTGVYSSPSVRIYEVPYYGFSDEENTDVVIWDNPPVSPEISFQPIRTERNKIFISINPSVDDYKAEPIIIQESDNEIFKLIDEYQQDIKDGKVRFKSDSYVDTVQVFRIEPDPVTNKTKEPISYSDFRNQIYKVRTRTSTQTFSFIDDIKINAKYYYCFRSIDDNNNISNPSPVFEVEMLGQDGSLLGYPVINIIDMDSEKIMNPKKTLNRYLNINPSPLQLEVAVPDNPDIQSSAMSGPPLAIGRGPSSLFVTSNKGPYDKIDKFKIRLTSKRTGKKIDVNIRFIHKHLE